MNILASSAIQQGLNALADFTVIEIHSDEECRSNRKGIGIALDLLAADYKQPIIMLGWRPESGYAVTLEGNVLFSFPKVGYLQLPGDSNIWSEIYREVAVCRQNHKVANPLALPMLQLGDRVNGLGALKHDAKYVEGDPQSDRSQAWLSKARFLFGNRPLEELVAAVNAAELETLPGRFQGQEFPGLFVDIEGTLVVDGALNVDVLEQIKAADAAQRPVTLWSGGDLAAMRKMVSGLGMRRLVVAKADFRGAKVEEAIDNEPLDSYGIEAQTLIGVGS